MSAASCQAVLKVVPPESATLVVWCSESFLTPFVWLVLGIHATRDTVLEALAATVERVAPAYIGSCE